MLINISTLGLPEKASTGLRILVGLENGGNVRLHQNEVKDNRSDRGTPDSTRLL